MLHVIYRSYGGQNRKGRPFFYSKSLALKSMVRAATQLGTGSAEIIYLNDGPIPADRLNLMERSGEVLALSSLGLIGSLQKALDLPVERGWNAKDLVWLAEDDYLYLPNALSSLTAAGQAYLNADYFALYAQFGFRQPNGEDWENNRVPPSWHHAPGRIVNGHFWRPALSTTSTFGARACVLAEDSDMIRVAMRSGGAWDHTTCLMYQGHLPYPFWTLRQTLLNREGGGLARRLGVTAVRLGLDAYHLSRRMRGEKSRLLISPDPALITHMETAQLATGTDWVKAASEIEVN